MISTKQTEGICLKSIKFRDNDAIINVFTAEYGLIKLIIHHGCNPRNPFHSLTLPLTHSEYLYNNGKNEIHRLKEGSLINYNLQLRQKASSLDTACAMARLLLNNLYPEKPAPLLYQLFLYCLEKIPMISDINIIYSLFIIKFLKHEGLLFLPSHCSVCQKPLNNVNITHGEAFCDTHTPQKDTLTFTQQEMITINQIANSRTLQQIDHITVSSDLNNKINNLITTIYR